ncbi:MAG: hypothetical protein KF744_05490 [Taibaiella sp.]|nr:hypothetical protein [Taibaiella sp.]
MKRTIVSLFALSCFAAACEHADNGLTHAGNAKAVDVLKATDPNIPMGKWKVFSYSVSPIVALNDSAIAVYCGKDIVLKKDIAVLFDDTCLRPNYEIRQISLAELDKEYSPDISKWQLDSQSIYTVDLSCESIITSNSFVVSNKVLTVLFDGVFFHARQSSPAKSE